MYKSFAPNFCNPIKSFKIKTEFQTVHKGKKVATPIRGPSGKLTFRCNSVHLLLRSLPSCNKRSMYS